MSSAAIAAGYVLAKNNGAACPASTTECANARLACCPSSLTCFTPSFGPDVAYCCPNSNIDCGQTVSAQPACANSTWSLWNDPLDGNGPFCCQPGEIGQIGIDGIYAQCVNSDTSLPASELAPTLTKYSGTTATDTTGLTTISQSTGQNALVPSLVLETISTGPPTPPPTHSSIPPYTGSGNLLQGYCATPEFILLDGPTAYWAPAIGCVDDKTDCCPYSAVQPSSTATATTVTVISTVIVNVGPGGTTQSAYSSLQAFPVPASADQATLAHCPADYQTVSGGCCPSGYELWNAPLGGQVPCYSSLTSYLIPPAVPVTSQTVVSVPLITSNSSTSNTLAFSSTTQKPTSAIVNVVFALQFPVQPAASGLSTGEKAGIGAGAGVAGIAIIVLSLLLVWRIRKHKKDREALTAIQDTRLYSTHQSQSVMSSVSPYSYSTRAELQADGANHPMQTPSGFMPQGQGGYFPQR